MADGEELDLEVDAGAPPAGTVAATEAADVYASYGSQLVVTNFGRDLGGTPVILNPDIILVYEDKKRLRSQLYDQMLLKDSKLAGLWTTRLNALLSLPWIIQPASDDPEHLRQAAIVTAVFAGIPKFAQFIARVAYGRWRSPSIQEIIWTDAPVPTELGPLWMIRTIEDRIPDRFFFDLRGNLRLRTSPWSYESAPLPARKFLVYAPDATTLNPYGISLGSRAYYAWWQRIKIAIFELRRLDKMATPPLVLKTEKGDKDPQAKAAFRNVKQLQNGSDLHLRLTDELEPLKIGDNGAADYDRAYRRRGDELAELVTGHVGAGGEKGNIDLSGGQSTITSDIRSDYQEADVAGVFGVLSELARWIVEFNVGVQPEGGYPTVLVPPEFLDNSAETLAQIKGAAPFIGDRIGKRYVQKKLGIPEMEPDDEPIGTGIAAPQPAPDAAIASPTRLQLAAAGVTSATLVEEQERDRSAIERTAAKAMAPLFAEMRAAVEEYLPPGKA